MTARETNATKCVCTLIFSIARFSTYFVDGMGSNTHTLDIN